MDFATTYAKIHPCECLGTTRPNSDSILLAGCSKPSIWSLKPTPLISEKPSSLSERITEIEGAEADANVKSERQSMRLNETDFAILA